MKKLRSILHGNWSSKKHQGHTQNLANQAGKVFGFTNQILMKILLVVSKLEIICTTFMANHK